ncbi:(Dimethylallyl)adenosine tRNA methylthiotransferase MiaB [Nitrospira sp. KM1]|nr:tRNA (N6-isopentenyl adenosine(37)-C2)-methylthiotransferase MiaB [Nitrospira sp. KM1]BCA53401.1 (Dimethylallyl)adenosine tRNA methylthiotransferase MiaB [Nitrospira sp. KM1]
MSQKPAVPLVHIETFGCQMNEYDSELVRSLLKREGFQFTEDRECADVILMNTCAIRENAHNKVFTHLSDLRSVKKHRPLVVGVLGCMAQNLKAELPEKEPIVDVLAGPDSYRQLPQLITNAMTLQEQGVDQKRLAVELSEYETYDDIVPERNDGVNAWIAIMRGCDNFCSFCVVPYTRGRERSRNPKGILEEARLCAEQGFKQVTLLGQNVNSYSYDTWDFARLLLEVADVPGLERVRFTSPHPKDFPVDLLKAVSSHPNICKHIHLPVQSGNDRVLEMMNRTYTCSEYLSLVDRIRTMNTQIALTTDIIAGFCSETDEEFSDTIRLVETVRFHSAFIFKYSERKNTIAARKYRDDVPEAVKSERVTALVDLQRKISFDRNREYVGSVVNVLVEGNSKRSSDQGMGKTDGNITAVWEKNGTSVRPGDMVPLSIYDSSASTLYGIAQPQPSSP